MAFSQTLLDMTSSSSSSLGTERSGMVDVQCHHLYQTIYSHHWGVQCWESLPGAILNMFLS